MNTRNQLLTLPGFRAFSPLRDSWHPIADLFDEWLPASVGLTAPNRFAPTYEVEEEDDHFLLSVELPGVKKEDLKIEFKDSQLLITGERRYKSKAKKDGNSYSEKVAEKFQRFFTLPAGVDPDKVEANYQDGILKIVVPKAESAKPRQIKITQGKDNAITSTYEKSA